MSSNKTPVNNHYEIKYKTSQVPYYTAYNTWFKLYTTEIKNIWKNHTCLKYTAEKQQMFSRLLKLNKFYLSIVLKEWINVNNHSCFFVILAESAYNCLQSIDNFQFQQFKLKDELDLQTMKMKTISLKKFKYF